MAPTAIDIAPPVVPVCGGRSWRRWRQGMEAGNFSGSNRHLFVGKFFFIGIMANDINVVLGPSAPSTGGASTGDILWVVGGIVLAIVLALIFFFYVWRREAASRAQEQIDHPPAKRGADEDKISALKTMKYSALDLEDGKTINRGRDANAPWVRALLSP